MSQSACDSDAGAIDVIALVHEYQDRRQRLGCRRVGERAGVQSAQPTALGDANDGIARLGVVAEHEHVAIDLFIGREFLCRHVVERGYDPLIRPSCPRRGGPRRSVLRFPPLEVVRA